MATAQLDALLEYVRADGRVCPQPRQWDALWKLLPAKEEVALPLILAAWWDTPDLMKMLRFREHIEHAAAKGALDAADRFLRALPQEDWHTFRRVEGPRHPRKVD